MRAVLANYLFDEFNNGLEGSDVEKYNSLLGELRSLPARFPTMPRSLRCEPKILHNMMNDSQERIPGTPY